MPGDDQAERYRQTAEAALRNLDWCVEYLRSNHKRRLARAIANNCASIRRRLAEPPPGDDARRS